MLKNFNIVALSPVQEGMLYHSLEQNYNDVYITNFTLNLSGMIDRERLNRAWQRVIFEHEALRTIYRWKGLSHPVQIIFAQRDNYIEFIEKESCCDVHLSVQETRIDLENSPIRVFLYDLAEEQYLLHIQYHHICMDGWSLGLMITKLWDYYDQDFGEFNSDEVKGVLNYEHYIQHLNAVRQCDKAKIYWDGSISCDAAIDLPGKQYVNRNICSTDHQLNNDLMRDLERYCKDSGFTLSMAIYAAWAILLSKYNDVDDVCFGTTVSGRDNFLNGIEDSIGLYIQTPPLTVNHLSGEKTLLSILQQVKNIVLEREAYSAYPLAEIQSLNHISHQLFDTIVVIENYPIARRLKELSSQVDVTSYTVSETTNFNLCLEVNLLETAVLKLSYNASKYETYVISNVMKHIEQILHTITRDDVCTVAELCLLDEQEYQQNVVDFNSRQTEVPQYSHLIDAWKDAVSRYGDRIAIRQHDCSMTYNELDTRSNYIASVLQNEGIKHQDLVVVQCPAGMTTIALFLAIIKLGAAYVPLDVSTPDERVHKIMSNGISHLLTQQDIYRFEGLSEERDWKPSAIYSETDLLYTIFTSGSTGEPKGVMLEHRTVMNYVQWAIRSYHPAGEHIVYPLFTNLAFDLTVTSLWCPLVGGGEIHIIDKEPFSALQDVAHIQELTNIKITPSQLSLLSQLMNDDMASLHTFVLGGEQLDSQLCREVTDKLCSGVRLFNEYGPTEATVGCMIWQYEKGDDTPAVAIGAPIDNAKIYILDRFMKPQPVGIPGEIYIGGSVLARGYLNQPELTAEKFVDNPFDNQRMYKTGDLAFFNEKGYIEYIGRKDNQVKLRGYRIELDEIATRIKSYDGCRHAAVVIKDINGESQLVSYYVATHEINEEELRKYLSETLPGYMIPVVLKQVEIISLTTNGKVDISSLPDVTVTFSSTNISYSTYREKILDVFSSVLEIENVDVHASLFKLGANSIKLLRITSMLNNILPVSLKIVDFFTYPTIASLIAYIESDKNENKSLVNREKTLSRREQMASRRKRIKKRETFADLINGVDK